MLAMDSTYRRRLTGAVVGLLVAIPFAATAHEGAGGGSYGAGQSLIWTTAMLLAGTIGGGLVGPAATKPTTAQRWISVIGALAGSAVVVGAFVVTLPIALSTAAPGVDAVQGGFTVLSSWLAFGVSGVLILGVPALILVLLPAGMWAVAMAWLGGRAER